MGPGTIWNRRLEKAAQRINTELDKIEDDKDEVNTKKTTKWAVNTFSDFLRQRQNNSDFETYSASLLNETLQEFYASVQSTAGREYSVASLMSQSRYKPSHYKKTTS